jgi:hypothetical protein
VRNPGAIFLPPSEMQIWGGNSADDLKLIAKVTPPQEEQGRTRIEGLSMDLPPSNYKYYQLVAKPVKKLLKGNPKKRDIWLMVDEVFFN